MEHLPDDVLLMVMEYLSVPDLLACRLVCKRIGAVALHPHLWRRRRVSFRDRFCAPVLRLAPCLAHLHVELPAKDQALYSSTRCAVSSLLLRVRAQPYGGSAVNRAALVIHNQEVLGRLKGVDIQYEARYEAYKGADAPALLWALAVIPGLETLEVDVTGLSKKVMSKTSLPTARARSSLRSFTCSLRPELRRFCEFVLSTHADTMEEVNFKDEFSYKTLRTTSPASLLARMPNLRRLIQCPLLPGMDALAACESLERVVLQVEPEMRDAAPQAEELLRRAKQLRNVTIEYSNGASTKGVGVNLVRALVSSGPSLVESLTIINNDMILSTEDPEHQLLQPVMRALPLMSALQELELETASKELLLAITPATNPVLRTVKLHPIESEFPLCAHEYLHWDSVDTLLSRNPSLDLVVYTAYYCIRNDQACVPCELGCHGEIWESEWRKECEAMKKDKYNDPSCDWIHIPRLTLNLS